MNGGQEQDPKFRTRGLPLELALRRDTVFLVARSYTDGLGAGSPSRASCTHSCLFSNKSFMDYYKKILNIDIANSAFRAFSSP